jgi:Na+/H+-translocating membrane pyrophosphatase
MNTFMIYVPIIMAFIGLLFMVAKRAWVLKQDAGDGKMKEISDYIYEGALAFLKAEYRLLAVFVLLASAVLAGILIRVVNYWRLIPVRKWENNSRSCPSCILPDGVF